MSACLCPRVFRLCSGGAASEFPLLVFVLSVSLFQWQKQKALDLLAVRVKYVACSLQWGFSRQLKKKTKNPTKHKKTTPPQMRLKPLAFS